MAARPGDGEQPSRHLTVPGGSMERRSVQPGSVRSVVSPDPVDARLLAMVAEMGRAAVHEVAARLGMDPREAAARLITLSGSGLPLLVGVECDPNGIRKALANSMAWGNYNGPAPTPARGMPPPYQPPPSVPFPAQQPAQTWGPPQSSAWVRGDQTPV